MFDSESHKIIMLKELCMHSVAEVESYDRQVFLGVVDLNFGDEVQG
jgi:hypothetical protein